MNSILKKISKGLNLTKLETEILEVLSIQKEVLNVVQLIHLLPNRGKNLYRSINNLHAIGLVGRSNTWPRLYKLKSDNELANVILNKQKYFDEILFLLQKNNKKRTFTEIIPNRTLYREFGRELMRDTKESLYILASGSEQDKDFFLEHTRLSNLGVKVRILVTKFNKNKLQMYKNWIKNGIEVKSTKEYHVNMVIYDKTKIQMGIKNDSISNEKTGFLIDNEYFVFSYLTFMKISGIWQNILINN